MPQPRQHVFPRSLKTYRDEIWRVNIEDMDLKRRERTADFADTRGFYGATVVGHSTEFFCPHSFVPSLFSPRPWRFQRARTSGHVGREEFAGEYSGAVRSPIAYFFFAIPSSSSFLTTSSPWLLAVTFLSMNFTTPCLSM